MEHKIEKLENLPHKEGRKGYLTTTYGNMWDLRRFDHRGYRSDKSDYAWVKAERAIKRFIGKSYDNAFSHFCKQVELFDQHEFDKYFTSGTGWNKYPSEYIVDVNCNIQYNPEYKLRPWRKRKEESKGVIFKSYDYKESYVNIHTGETNDNPYRYYFGGKKLNGDWVLRVIDGFWKEFESEFDKEYLRLVKEDAHRKELAYRRYEKWRKKHKQYDFRTDEEKKKEQEQKADIIKRDAHGFDDKSFKGEEYHGQKRKKNKK